MKFRKIAETSIYSSELEKMNEFYVNKLGLEFVSEQKGRHLFLKTQKNMLLIFNYETTMIEKESNHGATTPPSIVHIAFEIESVEYKQAKDLLIEKNIQLEQEIEWPNEFKSKSIYFRDPAGNLIEFITKNFWNIAD